MALNPNEFILKEPKLSFGVWATPETIDGDTDPTTNYTKTDDFGYAREGTIKILRPKTYVEYKSGTPKKFVRKDLIEAGYVWELTVNQFVKQNLEILHNLDTTTGTAFNVYWVGSDEPVKVRFGFLLEGFKVDGSAINFAIWSGEIITENANLEFPGDNYVDINFQIQAFEGPTFTTTPNDERNYGIYYDPV